MPTTRASEPAALPESDRIDADAVRDALDGVLGESLRPVSVGLGLFYALLSIWFATRIEGSHVTTLSISCGLLSVGFVVAAVWFERNELPSRFAHPAATADACTLAPELSATGACLTAGQGDPSGADVYESIIVGQRCVSGCHEPGGLQFADHQLDLSGAPEAAYAAVVDVPAKGAACAGADPATGQPRTLIKPFDCANSLLYQKLAAPGVATCGTPMPLGRSTPFPADQLTALCAWIDAGAPMTPASTSTCGP